MKHRVLTNNMAEKTAQSNVGFANGR